MANVLLASTIAGHVVASLLALIAAILMLTAIQKDEPVGPVSFSLGFSYYLTAVGCLILVIFHLAMYLDARLWWARVFNRWVFALTVLNANAWLGTLEFATQTEMEFDKYNRPEFLHMLVAAGIFGLLAMLLLLFVSLLTTTARGDAEGKEYTAMN